MFQKQMHFVFMVGLIVISGWHAETATIQPEMKGPCICALFNTTQAIDKDQPLIHKSYTNVTCNKAGDDMCVDLCTALGNLSRERVTQALCQSLENMENIVPRLYAKSCDNKWVYTGVSANSPICCRDQKPADCNKTSKVK